MSCKSSSRGSPTSSAPCAPARRTAERARRAERGARNYGDLDRRGVPHPSSLFRVPRSAFRVGGDVPEEEVRTVEVRVPVIRLPRLPTGETITLPDRRTVAELRDYLFEHLYEHRAALDAA